MCVGIVFVCVLLVLYLFVLCRLSQLSPFWPRILFGFRSLQSGIALLAFFLSIKIQFNSP